MSDISNRRIGMNKEAPIIHFIKKNKELIKQEILDIDYDIVNNHPILGKCNKEHSFFKSPLYRHMDPTEPQLTKALSSFLKDNPLTCKAFLDAIFTSLKQDVKLPDTGYVCKCEEITKNVRSKEKQQKRIDNVIIWKNKALCIEVKFDATIKNNDLAIYEQQMKSTANGKETIFVVISITHIQDIINKKKKKHTWHNLIWSEVLKKWEYYIRKYQIIEDDDIKRYRSSLWQKIS